MLEGGGDFRTENGKDDDTKYFGKLRVWLVGLDIKLRKLIQSSPIYHFSVKRPQYKRWYNKEGRRCAMPRWAIAVITNTNTQTNTNANANTNTQVIQ